MESDIREQRLGSKDKQMENNNGQAEMSAETGGHEGPRSQVMTIQAWKVREKQKSSEKMIGDEQKWEVMEVQK